MKKTLLLLTAILTLSSTGATLDFIGGQELHAIRHTKGRAYIKLDRILSIDIQYSSKKNIDYVINIYLDIPKIISGTTVPNYVIECSNEEKADFIKRLSQSMAQRRERDDK